MREHVSDDIHTYNWNTTCTMCGKPLDEFDRRENFSFDYHVGYGSRHDLEHVRARFCCKCFDSILDHLIDDCAFSPVVEEYDLIGEKGFYEGTIDSVADDAS